jgi:hypothetical protein
MGKGVEQQALAAGVLGPVPIQSHSPRHEIPKRPFA